MPHNPIGRRRRRQVWLQGVGAIIVLTALVDALAQSGSSTQPSLAKQELVIVNDANIDLNFQLSCDDEDDEDTWENFVLARGASSSYNCPNLPHLWIRIKTEGRTVQYKLEFRKRYRLAWSSAKKSWDVFRFG